MNTGHQVESNWLCIVLQFYTI